MLKKSKRIYTETCWLGCIKKIRRLWGSKIYRLCNSKSIPSTWITFPIKKILINCWHMVNGMPILWTFIQWKNVPLCFSKLFIEQNSNENRFKGSWWLILDKIHVSSIQFWLPWTRFYRISWSLTWFIVHKKIWENWWLVRFIEGNFFKINQKMLKINP